MSRIREAFTHGKAFIPFITCGDPSVELTEKIVYAMEEAGADLIELGIPFSRSNGGRPGDSGCEFTCSLRRNYDGCDL